MSSATVSTASSISASSSSTNLHNSHNSQQSSSFTSGSNVHLSNTVEGGKPKKAAVDSVLGVPLAFPSTAATSTSTSSLQHVTHLDPTPSLSTLRDDQSSYAVVTKTCLQITQFSGHPTLAITEESTTIRESQLSQDAVFSRIVSTTLQALYECLQNHKDRRCRTLALQTAALLGKGAYARLRSSALMYTQREPMVSRLEDEIATELPTVLCTTLLDQDDPAVAAAALAALGALVVHHSSSTSTQTTLDGALSRELASLASPRHTCYAPTLTALVDEDVSIVLQELTTRILENVVSPRLWNILDRVLHFKHHSVTAVTTALPFLTTALVHQVSLTAPLTFGMDQATYAKQWTELDSFGLVDTAISAIILPLMDHAVQGQSAHAASLAGLRLCHACPQAPWVARICRAAVHALQEVQSSTPQALPHKLHTAATLLIAARAIPIQERTATVLLRLVEPILFLPGTLRVPAGPGLIHPGMRLCEFGTSNNPTSPTPGSSINREHYRTPARLALWTELALSFFVDGPSSPMTSMGSNNNNSNSLRQVCLRKFFSMSVIANVIGEAPSKHAAHVLLTARDELLVAFCQTAIGSGRRFRGGPSGDNWPLTDPSSAALEEWLQLSWVVLTAFVPCVNLTGSSSNRRMLPYLEEDVSLGTAGLALYVQLLQEYLHFAGLLHPGSSVALKLVANACPPHLLWDQLTESASFVARFEAVDMGLLENTTKLMEEIVVREVKQGIPSHHMRLFLLALAADHWMQGRVAGIRKQFEGLGQSSSPPNLDVSTAREIILALGPKRILSKILASHVPPVDSEGKKKRDPVKRLAAETAKVCVACIENMALIACDWRKRFANNSSTTQEAKHVVSVSVGVLQGKSSGDPHEGSIPPGHLEMIQALIAPICEAAVGRIQNFYESEMGGADSFPASELVMQAVKTKIKPLVSASSRPPSTLSKDDYLRGYMMQLCRQLVIGRVDQALHTFPPADAEWAAPARSPNWLRLAVPAISDSRDGRILGNRAPFSATQNAMVSSAASDPVAMVLTYTYRRYMRHDGQDEFRLTALMRVYNTTAITFLEGLKLELGLAASSHGSSGLSGDLGIDALEQDIKRSLGLSTDEDDLPFSPPMASASVVYKPELKPGEFLSWEISLDHQHNCTGESLSLVPTVVFRNVPIEPQETGAKWASADRRGGEASTMGGESTVASGEDDFQVKTESSAARLDGEGGLTENITLTGRPLEFPPLLGFQPCPLVFLRDRWGDLDSFRFLWFRLRFHLPEIPIARRKESSTLPQLVREHPMMQRVADMSSLTWNGEAIPGGYVTRAWAFSTLSGSRVLCVLSETDGDKKLALHFRGDDKASLYTLVGPPRHRLSVVPALLPPMEPLDYMD